MAKILTILAMLLVAVSALFGLIELATAVLFCVSGGLLAYAIERKVSAWGVMVLCALSGGAMAAAMTGPADTSMFLSYLVSAWSELSIIEKIVGVFWLLVPAISVFVSVTATPKDNGIWGKYLYPFIELLALQFFKAKQKPGDDILNKPWRS